MSATCDEVRPNELKPEQKPEQRPCKNLPNILLSSLSPELDSRQPIPTLVFDSFTVRNSYVVNTEFEPEFFLGKWRNNRCDGVRERRDGCRRGRRNKDGWSKLHCALRIKVESRRDTRISNALRTHTNWCVPPTRRPRKCRVIHRSPCISIFLILLHHREQSRRDTRYLRQRCDRCSSNRFMSHELRRLYRRSKANIRQGSAPAKLAV